MTRFDLSQIPWDVITPDMEERAALAIAVHAGDDQPNDEDWTLARIVLEAALGAQP